MAILGYNTIGGSSGTNVKFWACKFTSTQAGTITDLNFYGSSTGSANYKLAIWADSAGTTGSKLAESAASTINTTVQWWTRPISYTFAANETLWFGFVSDDWENIYSDAGSTNQFAEFTQDFTSYPTVPNPPTVGTNNSLKISIYANYTPAATGVSTAWITA